MRRAPAAAEALKTHAQAISDVTSKLAAEEIMEGDAAKTLRMLLGPQVELVIASAVSANSGALARARVEDSSRRRSFECRDRESVLPT